MRKLAWPYSFYISFFSASLTAAAEAGSTEVISYSYEYETAKIAVTGTDGSKTTYEYQKEQEHSHTRDGVALRCSENSPGPVPEFFPPDEIKNQNPHIFYKKCAII